MRNVFDTVFFSWWQSFWTRQFTTSHWVSLFNCYSSQVRFESILLPITILSSSLFPLEWCCHTNTWRNLRELQPAKHHHVSLVGVLVIGPDHRCAISHASNSNITQEVSCHPWTNFLTSCPVSNDRWRSSSPSLCHWMGSSVRKTCDWRKHARSPFISTNPKVSDFLTWITLSRFFPCLSFIHPGFNI